MCVAHRLTRAIRSNAFYEAKFFEVLLLGSGIGCTARHGGPGCLSQGQR